MMRTHSRPATPNTRPPKFRSDRAAVSETLGDILLVIMSVIMLSTLALSLLSMPTPVGTLDADTVASFDGRNLTIEHVGGSNLADPNIAIDVGENYSAPSIYNIASGHSGGVLTVGESWKKDVSGVVGENDTVRVLIIDTKNERVLSEQMITKRADYGLLPDIGITRDDITFWRAGAPVDDAANAALSGDIVTINILVHNYGRVWVGGVKVATSVYMYTTTPLATCDIPSLNASGQPGDNASVSVQWSVSAWGPHTVYVRVVPLKNESVFSNNYANRQIRIGPGIVVPDAPDLNITAIYFSNSHPVHGETVKMFVRIANQGGMPASASLTYWDRGVELFTDYNISVSAGQLLEVYTVWIPDMGGIHNMSANVSVIDGPPDDADPGNNDRTVLIEVLPTIMLVDDDKAAEGSVKDVGATMKAALGAVAAQYTLYTVGTGDGPRFDTGPVKRRLIDFDLVIWLCGYESTGTLTATDMGSLKEFLDHGGKLWLIGQDITNDLTVTNGTFLTDYLHVSGKTLDTGVLSPIEGVPDNDVTANMTVPLNPYPWGGYLTDLGDTIVNDSRSVAAFRNASSGNRYGLMFNASTNSSGPTYTLAFLSFEFSQIRSANDRASITYSMLKWFDCLTKWGRDLALSEEVIGKLNPDFMDEVNITVFVRNNGMATEPVGADRVLVLFLMDNTPMTPYEVYINDSLQGPSATTNPIEVPNVTGDGGVVRVTLKWLANKVGTHAIRIIVDPFDFIDEVDEQNNEVWGSSQSLIMVRYAVMVVDDDDSDNNHAGDPNYNSTFAIMRALDRLGYNVTLYIVPGATQNGPPETMMRRFNTVIWLTGQCAPGAPDPLTGQDLTNLAGYLSAGDNRGLWLIGQDMFASGTYSPGNFVYDYLHVSTVTRGQGVPNPLMGVKNDDVGHGINYTIARTFNPASGGSIAVPRADAHGVTYANISNGSYNAVRYESAAMGYRTIFCGYDLSFIAARGGVSEVEYESELVFMAMRWLGMPELRIELRVTEMDLYYGNMTPLQAMNPAMGNSYVVKAIVSNLGGTRGDTAVRFLDCGTVIGTSFLSVAPGGKTVAEIIWTPLFAGQRTIWVQLDPDGVVAEIMKFNDRAGIGLRSYFFYDDLENGTRNWRHEATIVRINGESALEYMDVGNVSTGVSSSWQTLSGFRRTTEQYHSMNSSFYMREPGPPLDLVLVLDTSNSMSGTPLQNEKDAAKALLYSLANDSRVAIFHAAASDVQRAHLGYTPLSTGLETVENSIDALGCQAWSQLWLTTGEAIQYALDYHTADRIPAVVLLSDGQDFQGSDSGVDPEDIKNGDWNGVEFGSNGNAMNPGYDPWTNWGTQQVFGHHWGKYFGAAAVAGTWFNQTFTGQCDTAKGLLNSPIPIMTIGLNLEHDANLPAFATIATATTKVTRTGSVYTGPGSQESGTPEYNLYRMSSTSPGGRYFYSPAASDLAGVFDQVGEALSQLALSRRGRDDSGPAGGAPTPDTRPPTPSVEGGASGRAVNVPGNNDRYAITTSFDLRGVSLARLCFWQKYQITMGSSGCVLLVGTSADNVTFNYSYMTPTQSYKGNIKTSVYRYDDHWREMRWCWNGISGKGAFDWEYVEVSLNQFCGQQYVRAMFAYLRAGGGGGKGWWIDDIEVKVTRSDSVAVADTSMDQWELVKKGTSLSGGDTADAYSGQYAWLCHNPNPSTDYLKAGLDDCLITIPINLVDALDATLIAKFKFNLNYTEGRPPDGFRVEVSSDTGVTWRPVHFGVRAAWKVSGTEAAGGDGKSFTGVNIGNNWVYSNTLARLNCDLSGWAGSVIQLRFRVVTRTDAVNHYETANGWGGLYIDDITVFGNTTTGGRGSAERSPDIAPGYDEAWEEASHPESAISVQGPEAGQKSGGVAADSGTVRTGPVWTEGSNAAGQGVAPIWDAGIACPATCTILISREGRAAVVTRGGDVE